jgi:hypothetical protein
METEALYSAGLFGRYTICSKTEKAIHPDIEILILHRDAELPPKQLAAVAAHLDGCDSCRVEYHRLCAALDWVRKQAAGGTASTPPMGLSTLRARLQELVAERVKSDRRGELMQHKVLAEIAPFLGDRAANRLLWSVSETGQDLLSIIEPVLANFLGDRAAAELVNRLVDTAMGKA